MKIESIYHRGVTSAAPDDRLRRCAEDMTGAGVSALPIVAEERLLGIITEGDLVRAMARGADFETATARAHMTPDAVTVSAEDDTADAALKMFELGVRHLPVAEAGRLVGMVSSRDLLVMEAWPPVSPR